MCLFNTNTKQMKNKHLTFVERQMIERNYNIDKSSVKTIAKFLGRHERTIKREFKRRTVTNLTMDLIEISVYSATVVQEHYDYNMSAKGPALLFDNRNDVVQIITERILEEKKSPEVIAFELARDGLIAITGKTIRNAIKLGTVFNLATKDLTYKCVYKEKNKDKRICRSIPSKKALKEDLLKRKIEVNLVIGKAT